ncbi:MAG: Flp family type IVb pilin [Actinomycetia bacterium]|nr:Flp family type IVb pilin [Actinomycetes bacterium]
MMNRLRQQYLRTTVTVRDILKGETGASMVEYGLLVALIAVVAIVSVVLFGNTVAAQWSDSADSIVNA